MSITHLSLFRRSNGFWYILYSDEGRVRWRSTRSKVKSEALSKLTEFQDLLKGKPKPVFLSQFADEFLSFARMNYAKPTVDIFVIALKHLQSIARDCLLTSLTQKHLDLYKTERLQAVRPTSVNVELRALRAILNIAVRWKLLESNPFSRMQLVRTAEVIPSYLNRQDIEKLFTVIKENWFKEIVILAVLTGMRRGEILNLQWQDLDLDQNVLKIQSNPTFRVKSGKKRTIPLNDLAVQMLRRKMDQSKAQYVFNLNGRKISESYVTHKFKDYLRHARLNEELHFHSLRHTFATLLIKAGTPIYEVQKLLGHSSVKVTEIYSHLAPTELHSSVNKIMLP